MKKEVKIVRKKGKYCVVAQTKNNKYRNLGSYNTEDEAQERFQQIYTFKNKKALLLNIITNISDELESKGLIHLADAVINCGEDVVAEKFNKQTALRFSKVMTLLQKREQNKLAEQLASIVPEILAFVEYNDEKSETGNKRLPADRVYKMAIKLKDKYITGLIDENSFEYSKLKEFESMLKTGFLLPAPSNYETLPDDATNWWDHFSKRSK